LRRYTEKKSLRQTKFRKNIELDWDAVPDNWDKLSPKNKLKLRKLLSKYGIRKIVKDKILGLS
jgi:hypothetical protein